MNDHKPSLVEEATYDISDNYLRCKMYQECHENAEWEDGIHDLYPVYGEKTGLYFLSTGERVFLFDATKVNNVGSGKITLEPFKPFYEIDSVKSRKFETTGKEKKVVLKKGGVKTISGFIKKTFSDCRAFGALVYRGRELLL